MAASVVGCSTDRAEDSGSSSISVTATTTSTTIPPLPIVSDEIAALADRTTMTDEARRVFYEADPQLVDKVGLGDACPLREEASVLGCFGSGGVTILAIADPRLDGMVATTAAHEMLHAAWVALDASERQQLGDLLCDAYDAIDDADLRERVEAYRRADPSVVKNELHSILGTEVADLSAALETYYQRWFVDRRTVVALANAAQSAFEALEAQVAALDAELATRAAAIDAENGRLAGELAAIDAQRAELEQLAAEGRIDEYNDAVPAFNDRVQTFNDAVQALNEEIDRYNQVIVLRNALVDEYAALAEPIDTALAPASTTA
ncbi:MAG: hypothetical protein ACT4OX_05500 [Actinomycetota bacterium]